MRHAIRMPNMVRWVWASTALLLGGCGAPPQAELASPGAQQLEAPSLRKPPTLASTIYDVACDADADCILVPQGDVCLCAQWGAIRADNETKFLQRRARLGTRCADKVAAVCASDSALVQARCQNKQCIAAAPKALACVDHVLERDWPQSIVLGQAPTKTQEPGLSACPGGALAPTGQSEVFLLHPKAAGKYRIALSDHSAAPRTLWLMVRTPDCHHDNVACRVCTQDSERCLMDEVLGPDDTAVIVVRGCDADCRLRIDQWDITTPLVPPF